MEAYRIMESGHLMYEGGMSAQTMFFYKASYMVKNKLKEKEAESMEKMSKKSKKK